MSEWMQSKLLQPFACIASSFHDQLMFSLAGICRSESDPSPQHSGSTPAFSNPFLPLPGSSPPDPHRGIASLYRGSLAWRCRPPRSCRCSCYRPAASIWLLAWNPQEHRHGDHRSPQTQFSRLQAFIIPQSPQAPSATIGPLLKEQKVSNCDLSLMSYTSCSRPPSSP